MNQKLHIAFDKSGTIQKAYFIAATDTRKEITQSDAIQIALNELRSGKYNILDFNEEDISIIVKSVVIDGKDYYSVYIDNIPYEKLECGIVYTYYEFILDLNTGKPIYVNTVSE